MVIWMEHPKHGRHPATGAEVAAMEANGWIKSTPKNEAVADEVLATVAPEPAAKRAYNRKVK